MVTELTDVHRFLAFNSIHTIRIRLAAGVAIAATYSFSEHRNLTLVKSSDDRFGGLGATHPKEAPASRAPSDETHSDAGLFLLQRKLTGAGQGASASSGLSATA